MAVTTMFDYYYGDESSQFSFYRIPRQLVTGEQFKGLGGRVPGIVRGFQRRAVRSQQAEATERLWRLQKRGEAVEKLFQRRREKLLALLNEGRSRRRDRSAPEVFC